MEKQMTIILTVSVRVTIAEDKDIDTICANLEGSIAATYNNGIISEGCHEDTSVDAVEPETEVIDEEEEGTND